MARKAGALFVLYCLSLLAPIASGQQPLRWEPTLDQAQRIASQTNRLVLIHFWAPWCGVCKRMETELLPQPAVAAALNANYVLVKIDADHFPATARQFGVTALPTTVILSPQGQVLDNMRGRLEPDQYLGRLNQAVAATRQRAPAAYAQVPAQAPPQVTPQVPPSAPQIAARSTTVPPSNPNPRPTSDDRYADFYRRSQATSAAPPATQQQPAYASAAPTTGPYLGYPQQPSTSAPAAAQPSPAAVAQNYPQMPAPIANPAAVAPVASSRPIPVDGPNYPVGLAPQYGSQMPAPNAQPAYLARNNQPTSPALANQPMANPATGNAPTNIGPTSNAMPQMLPPGNPPLGLDGFCPVTLCEKQVWVAGDRRWGAIHRGRTYLFAGPDEQRRFFTDPDRYSPAMGGNDIVLATEQNEMVPGMRRHGVFCGNRIYLFSSEATLEKFARNPTLYTNKATEALQSSAVPGQPLR